MINLDEILKSNIKSEHPWRDTMDCVYDELNIRIRKELENNLKNRDISSREKEVRKILEEEKKKYDWDKEEFYANPIHWSNNKRKMNGMQTLRGNINKSRNKKFRCFKPTPRVLFVIEDYIDEMLPVKISEHFNKFVDIKDLGIGDKNEFRISE